MKLIQDSGSTVFARQSLALACSLALLSLAANAHADQAADMQAKLDALQKQVSELQAQMNAAAAKAQKQEEAAVSAAAAPSTPGVRSKPGDALTFQIGDHSEATLYVHATVMAD